MLTRRVVRITQGIVAMLLCWVTLSAEAALEGILLAPPSGQAPQRLLVLLHGYGSNEQDLLPLADFVAQDYAVVSLQAPITVGPHRFAWYRNGSGAQADIYAARQQILTRIAQIQRQLKISPNKTLLAGFSQGAVLSWSIALNAPESIGAAAIFSGRLPESVGTSPTQQNRPNLPKLFVGHGQRDQRIALALDEQAVALAQHRGYSLSFHRYADLGHGINEQELTDFKQWAAGISLQTPSS
ncbi:alpha/beta hydrolase [Rosenbergiella nectarea]|uniref:alpha/beta hydrolase n=1 Tax=Rosenbergiella nectarea TaxID=988801 RepID=UPI001F4D6BF8